MQLVNKTEINMSEKIPKSFITDPEKAHVMAKAEDPARTKAEFAKEAQSIVETAGATGEYVNFLDEAVKRAAKINANRWPTDWNEQKLVVGAPKALTAWENSLSQNAGHIESKHMESFVVDSAVTGLKKEVRRNSREADKAGDSAGRAYDRKQK
jgi:hypothetical protein